MNTPNEVEGYAFNSASGCNWRKCWALITPTDNDPFIILLDDDTLWIAPHAQPEGTWGSHWETRTAMPRPDTSTFIGPFESFDLAFATFNLMVTE